MKAVLTTLCLALLGAAVFGWLTARREAEEARALRLQLQAAHTLYAQDSARWADQRVALETERARLVTDSARVARRLAGARDSLRSTLGTLAALLAHAGVDSSPVLAEIDSAFAACEATVTNAEARGANCQAQLQVADSVAAANGKLAALYEKSWQNAERRARPHLFRDLFRSAPLWGSLALVLGVLAVLH